jgi:hypothetical protein
MNLYYRLIPVLLRMWCALGRALLDQSRVAFRVILTDCDLNFHLNSGRYLSFMDLGRVYLKRQTMLLKIILDGCEYWLMHSSLLSGYSRRCSALNW